MFKRFREEVGVGEDTKMDDLTTAISQEVVSEVLNNCKVKKQDMRKEGIRLRF